jgi:hypothetical protein
VLERFPFPARDDHPTHQHVKAMVGADRCAGPGRNPHAVALASGRYVTTTGRDVEWDQTVEKA